MTVDHSVVTEDASSTSHHLSPTVISIDAMSGDLGPKAVVRGMARICRRQSEVCFIVHGDKPLLEKQIRRSRILKDKCTFVHTSSVVSMSAKPSQIIRNSKGTSMWSAIETVREGKASVVVSCGNTGVLMALSVMRLKRAEGVNRPAIACLWPSTNPNGYNILLDVGADIKATPQDLLCFATLGAEYAKAGLGISRPRVGLLNVGTELHKGRQDIRDAHTLIESKSGDFEYIGFVEGSDIPSNRVDIIVTDGFTGNIALKSVEGTALLIRKFIMSAFRHTPLSRIGAIFAYTSIRRLYKRLDPRRANGGVMLGLNGMVVKSHGSSDAIAIEAALKLAIQLARISLNNNLIQPELSEANNQTVSLPNGISVTD